MTPVSREVLKLLRRFDVLTKQAAYGGWHIARVRREYRETYGDWYLNDPSRQTIRVTEAMMSRVLERGYVVLSELPGRATDTTEAAFTVSLTDEGRAALAVDMLRWRR